MELNSKGTPYIISCESLKYGSESWLIQEGIEFASVPQMMRIKRALTKTYELKDVVQIFHQRANQGFELWAFGKATEQQILNMPVNDLQHQSWFLITRAEQEGFKHDSYSECKHYFDMFLRGHDSQGMSWYECLKSENTRERYSKLLIQLGYPPVAKGGSHFVLG